MERDDHPAPASVRFRRLVRGWGLVFLIALGFLLLALFVRESPKTVPAQGLSTDSVLSATFPREV